MLDKKFVYRTRLTPSGKQFVEVVYDDVVIATGKHAHTSAEAAMSEVSDALDKLSLSDVIQPNGKILEKIP